ncbi:Protein-disulfide isomerase [Candidatus Electrothrix aarhusensis]|jgi:protein-disulfide isomerase|uniref:Protein-disulfide isomerase n=1 Tax=Candidatus Electrothrix aarhusensis TaxID=1859131 RepID=A0A3S3QC57_9BACT|nr:Protein-disulfide isomerase [Candidatus Electrothrix aarhusensis]
MKKTLTLCTLLLLSSSQVLAQDAPAKSSTTLITSPLSTWQMTVTPVDFAQSLDNKLVFVLGKDSKVHIYSSADGAELGSVPVAKETIGIDIAPRGEMLFLVDSNKKYTALDISFAQDIDTAGSPFLGKEGAPISLVVFSDFQCPFCSKVQPLLDEILKKNPDKLKIVFKHLPLQMHKQAKPAALASIAAHEQGKFWQMHDALFTVSKDLSKENIEKAAKDIGLDMEKFKKDLTSPTVQAKLKKDMVDAGKAGVGGTPTLFINGRQVKGRGENVLQEMIDQELAKK